MLGREAAVVGREAADQLKWKFNHGMGRLVTRDRTQRCCIRTEHNDIHFCPEDS